MSDGTFTRKINIYIESGQAQAAQEVLLANQDKFNAKLETQKQKYKDAYEKYVADPSKKAADAVKKLGNEIDKTKDQIANNTAALDRQGKKISGELSPNLKELTGTYQKLRREVAGLTKEDDPVYYTKKVAEMNKAKAAMDSYATSLTTVREGLKGMLKEAKGVAFGVLLGGGVQAMAQSLLSSFAGLVKFRNEYEASLKNLSAITGATGADLQYLDNAAVEMASSGSRSAKEFLEAMKLIGSAKPELLKDKEGLVEVTKAANLLAKASGLDLPDASKRLVDSLNQYGAPASEASKYVDILAASAKYGAAEIPGITDALLEFGPVAKQSNVSMYESSAAIELLAEKGVKGAEAGTKLRNVLLTLSAVDSLPAAALEQLKKYGVNTEILSDKTLSLEQRLTELSKVSGDANAMMQIFDKQNVVAGTILLENIPRYAALEKSIHETGVASAQASVNVGTLSGAWGKLTNAFKTLSLGVGLDWLKNMVSGLADGVTWFGKFTGVIQSNAVALQNERTELTLNEQRILALNVGNENRTKLIQELQDKYPSYLANLDAEKATNEEISAAIQKVNNSLLTKIALAQVEERLSDAATDRSKAELSLADTQLKMEKEIAYLLNSRDKNANKYNKEQLEGMSLGQQAAALLTGTIKLQEVSSVSLADLAKYTDQYNAKLATKNEAVDEYNKILEDQLQVESMLKQQLGITDVGGTPSSPVVTTGGGGESDGEAAKDKAIKDREDFLKKVQSIENESYLASLSANEREIVAVTQKYDLLREEAKKFGFDLNRLKADEYNELHALTEKQYAQDADTEYRLKLKGLEETFAVAKQFAKQEYADGIIDKEEYNNRLKQLDVALLKAKADLATLSKLDSQAAAADELSALRAAKDAELNLLIEAGNAKINAQKITDDQLEALAMAKAKKDNDRIIQAAQFLISAAQGIGQIMTNIENAELARDKKLQDEKAKQFKRQLDSKKISQKQYDNAIDALNTQADKKAHDIAVKQFKRNQAIQIVMAIINTASAVMNAFATSGNIYAGIALAAMAAATGAIQIGVIASEKPPAYAAGNPAWRKGIGGDRHADASGGNPIVDPNTGETLGVVERGEAFIPVDSTEANQPAINWMLNNRGKPLPNFNFSRAIENVQYATGNSSWSNRMGSTATEPNQKESIGVNEMAVFEITKENARQVAALTEHVKNIRVNLYKYDLDRYTENDDYVSKRTAIKIF